MRVVSKCDLCDTALEYEDGGKHWTFTAHTSDFCHVATLDRIRVLTRALELNAETCRHAVESFRRDIDRWCEERGYQALAQHSERMARDAEVRMARRLQVAAIGPSKDLEALLAKPDGEE